MEIDKDCHQSRNLAKSHSDDVSAWHDAALAQRIAPDINSRDIHLTVQYLDINDDGEVISKHMKAFLFLED